MPLHRTPLIIGAACVVTAAVAEPAAAQPRNALLRIEPHRTSGSASSPVVLAGDTFVVRGTLRPGLPGQRVTVRGYFGRKRVLHKTVVARPLSEKAAVFTVKVSVPSSRGGVLRLEATHRESAELRSVKANSKKVAVRPLRAFPGGSGLAVLRMQKSLRAMGFAVPTNGSYDAATMRAVMAYRKTNRMARIQTVNRSVLKAILAGKGAFKPRFPNHGRHVEADIGRQVLALIEGGKVRHVYHTSTGAPATPTILGTYRVYMKQPGTNAKGMVHSSYFIRGYAIHGYASVPPYPASHGCLRVPIPDAAFIYSWVRMGDVVDTYY